MAALYRRYRPETFAEVIGQAHVTDPLRRALLANRSHHAYLFSGPRGCGKTTSARILARCLNCAEGPTDSPCGVCPSCLELARDGSGSLDVVEIDAASHNGVDDARELRERAVFAPARDRYKIFILDEAHMVTQQGFNALLKIVEEPPEHVKFIFATTEPDKVLPTIRSRTHHYPFRLVPPGELLSYLESVAESEGVSVEPGVLALVVRSGGGSVRDTLSLLDQLIAGSADKSVSLESAQSLLGYTPRALLDQTMEALAGTDAKAAFHTLDAVMSSGQDPRRFVEDFLAHLRDVIVIQAAGKEARDLFPGVSESDIERWFEQSTWFAPAHLAELGHIVNESLGDMAGLTAPRLQLELMVARLLQVLSSAETTSDTPRSTSLRSSAPVAEQTVASVSPSDAPSNRPDAVFSPSTEAAPKAPAAESADTSAESLEDPLMSAAEAELEAPNIVLEPWTVEGLAGVWPAVIETLSQHKRSLWVALSETQPIGLEGDVVTLGFVRRQDAEILRKPQGPGSPLPNADLLRDVIWQHTGHRVRFTVGELSVTERATPSSSGSSWPVVASAGSEVVADEGDVAPASDGVSEEAASTADDPAGAQAEELEPATASLATRGEPVVREVLGGELIGEELLEEMSEGGDIDG